MEPAQKKENADSSREVEVIITANNDLIGWHRFQRYDDGITTGK